SLSKSPSSKAHSSQYNSLPIFVILLNSTTSLHLGHGVGISIKLHPPILLVQKQRNERMPLHCIHVLQVDCLIYQPLPDSVCFVHTTLLKLLVCGLVRVCFLAPALVQLV